MQRFKDRTNICCYVHTSMHINMYVYVSKVYQFIFMIVLGLACLGAKLLVGFLFYFKIATHISNCLVCSKQSVHELK